MLDALAVVRCRAVIVSLLTLWGASLAPQSCRAADVLAWETNAVGRSAVVRPGPAGKAGFTALPPAAAGVAFINTLPETRHLTNQILLNGAGVALGDADGDGLADIYLCCLDGSNALYRNLGNWRFTNLTAAAGVACRGLTSSGAAFADLDGDSDLDLVVNSVGHGTRVFFNDGQGRFTPAATVLNPGRGGMTAALADFDGDGFLDLYLANYRTAALMDMPNARATFRTVGGRQVLETVNGRPLTDPDLTNRFTIGPRGAIEENGEADMLYRGEGGTNFAAVPFTGGTFLDEGGQPLAAPPFEWGLTAAFRDLNEDGLPDLYVCNDFQTLDRVWLNLGGGRFRLIPRLAVRKNAMFSMAVDFADFNRDGHLDFFTLDMMSREHSQRMRYMGDRNPPAFTPGVYDDRPQFGLNMLFLNRGDGTYAEIGQLAGVEAAEWAWSCVFLDVDLDGWEDLLAVNGMERAARDMDVVEYLKRLRATRRMTDVEIFRERRAFPRLATANLAFRNRRDLTFEETGAAWGFDWRGVSQAMALADLDNDGDLDAVVNNLNAPPLILRNDSPAPRLAVRLRGLPPNTRGIGARIRVTAAGLPRQTQEIIAGGRYLAGDDAMRVFAAGSETNRLTIEVLWRSGRRSVLADAPANRVYEFDEAKAEMANGPAEASPPNEAQSGRTGLRPGPGEAAAQPWFEAVSARLNHRHHEESFDDFTRQPLLPNKLSQLGPGLAWFDLNGDGWDDLIVPGGKGGQLAALTNDTAGGFKLATAAMFTQPVTRDQTTALGWRAATAAPATLAVGVANYEDGQAIGAAVQAYRPGAAAPEDWLPATDSSTGPLALGDVDGDGDLDLFVGGRVVPGRYPAVATSRLFLNHAAQGQFSESGGNNSQALANVGLVSGAVFTDLTGDGFPELALACEWGPLRVFRNDHGKLSDWDAPLCWPEPPSNQPLSPLAPRPSSLAKLTGWWNSVAAADFDGDGWLDLVAGNRGRNTKYQAHRSQPLRLYWGDFGGEGRVDVLEAHYDAGLMKFVPERQLDILAASLPFLRGQFPTHRSFSTAGLEDVLGERLAGAKVVEAAWLETTALLNRGEHFEVRVLPVEAQFAPVFGIATADFDGDGAVDLFLAENFFGAQPETARYDAGRGLVLRGDGRGGFAPLAGQVSGVKVYGEQRGAAVADFDGDGRVDFAVAQNSAETRLFRNQIATPGLRVRLNASPSNPDGIGAQVRGVFGGGPGPALEVRAGGGYWSQDSSVLVVTGPGQPEALAVRWPGGKETRVAVPDGARAVEASHDGTLKVTSP
jgi:hypothetical protein